MFVVTVLFELKTGARAAFLPAILANAQTSLSEEKACQRFDVCCDPNDETSVFLYEIYDDEAGFKAHLDRDHFKDFNAETASLVAAKTVRTFSLC